MLDNRSFSPESFSPDSWYFGDAPGAIHPSWGVVWGGSWGNSWGPLHEVEDKPWDTSQGAVYGLKFEPLSDATITLKGHGVKSGSGEAVVETRSVTQVYVRSSGAFAGAGRVDVQTASSFQLKGYGVRAAGTPPTVSTFSAVSVKGLGARASSGRVQPYGETIISVKGSGAYAGSCGYVKCDTVKDMTDEELIYWYLHSRPIDMLTSKHV